MIITAALMGGNREAVSQDMLRSAASFTDRFLLVNTGPSADKAVDKAVAEFGDKCHVHYWHPLEGICAAKGRNVCLQKAQELGATWVLNLDTDERFVMREGLPIREMLDKTIADCLLLWDSTGTYRKFKFFRTPIKGTFQVEPTTTGEPGVHEYFMAMPSAKLQILGGAHFVELPRPPEQAAERMRGIERVSRLQVAENPKSSRSWYYLGETLAYRGAYEEALFALFNCYSTSDWVDERDWCLYKAAWASMGQGRMASAVEYCRLGAKAQPSWPEFPWLAAVACAKCSSWKEAIAFAEEAEALGSVQRQCQQTRMFFVNQDAWWEGPANVLRIAHANLNNVAEAKEAHERYLKLVEERQKL